MDPGLPPTSFLCLHGGPSCPCRAPSTHACNQKGLMSTDRMGRGSPGTYCPFHHSRLVKYGLGLSGPQTHCFCSQTNHKIITKLKPVFWTCNVERPAYQTTLLASDCPAPTAAACL